MRKSIWAVLIIVLLWLLAGCDQSTEPLPTRVPTAEAPPPTIPSILPPTRDLSPPTATFIASPTAPAVSSGPTETPLPSGEAAINITSPAAGLEVALGSEVTVSGLGQVGAGEVLSLTLVSATGHTLSEVLVEVSDFSSWQVALPVPIYVTGPAQLVAAVYDEATGALLAIDFEDVNLVLDTSISERYMALFRPLNGETAVAGYNLFFDGRAEQPVDNLITISLRSENCREEVARQSFRLRGSGYWQGFLILPQAVSGPACAVAEFGEPGNEDWREAQVLMNVLPASDENAQAVLVGNPPPNSTLPAGEATLLYGTAYNAFEGQVVVSILLENGRILSEGVADTDVYGYWEIELFVPTDAEGPASINVTIGTPGEDNYAQNQTLVTISPPG
jgi:hypothetical protein